MFDVYHIAGAFLWTILFWFSRRVRSKIATLADKDLHDFLTQIVLKEGVFFGLAQLGFLMFSSIQCDGNLDKTEVDHWENCNRTLYSQTALGIFVVIYLIIKITSGIAPVRLLEKHMVSVNKILAMDLNSE